MAFWKTAVIASVLAAIATVAHGQTEVKYTYDALGRLISVTYHGGDQDGATIVFSYDAAGNRTEVVRTSPIVAGTAAATQEGKVLVLPLLGFFVMPITGS